MKIYKKMFTVGILILLVGIFLFPSIQAYQNEFKAQYNQNNNDPVYDLIILTPRVFSGLLNPLVAHKETMGISSMIVSLDEIYSSQLTQDGRDEPEKIKYFIKYAVEEWDTKYVLLIGGKIGQTSKWFLPVRYVHMDNNWESEFISDLYYADIYDSTGSVFSDWDSNDNGVFAEWVQGEEPEDKYIDLTPDVSIGRLPCRNPLEVLTVVNKIISYETNTQNKPWFDRMVALAGDTYLEYQNPLWAGYEGEYYADRAFENMSGFEQIRLYTSDGSLSGYSEVVNEINKGCGFLYFVGHGNPMTWGNHPPNNKTFVDGLSVQHMRKLKNKDMYPVCVVSGCHNNQFDVSIFKILDKRAVYRGEATIECWGWWMTRLTDGGSIGTIGCTALGHTKEDKSSFDGGINELEVEFFKQYGQNNIKNLGDTWRSAVNWYIDTYPTIWDSTNMTVIRDSWVDTQVVQSWILFGDPSLKIGG